jgi:hypothetical protein
MVLQRTNQNLESRNHNLPQGKHWKEGGMKQYMSRLFLIGAIMILAYGCAIGNKYQFADVTADIQAANKIYVAVASLDQRQTVLSGESPVDYVGMQRGGFGNPFNVTTQSGLPFADAVSQSICQSLKEKGFNAESVLIKLGTPEKGALKQLLAKQAERSIFVNIIQWESDTYSNIGLTYDLTLTVFDENGSAVAQAIAKDTTTIPGSFVNPPAAAREKIPAAFKDMIERLLNDPQVRNALQ